MPFMKTLDRTAVYTETPLGQNQSITREGYLLCRDVPIARTGMQEYLNDEIADSEFLDDGETPNPLWGARGKNGIVQVIREEKDVFHPDALSSYEGKDVVDDHPDETVGPDNYEQHTVGVVLNPRRGENAFADFVIADLLIKKASAIAAVRAGKREVSGGYDADYEVLGPGRARQFNIIGNHVALVDRGRCGFRCAIGDEDMTKKTTDKKPSLFARVMDAIANKDRKALEDAMEEMEKEKDEASEKETMEATGTNIHIHLGGKEEASGKDPSEAGAADEEEAEGEAEAAKVKEGSDNVEKRLIALEAGHAQILEALRKIAARTGASEESEEEAEGDEMQGEEEAEGEVPETSDEEGEEEAEKKEKSKDKSKDKMKDSKTVRDSASLKGTFTETKSDAEILAPGLKMPTFDSAKPRKVTLDSICLLKRRALSAAQRDEKNGGKDAVAVMLGKKTLAGMDCASVDTVFNGAVALMRDRNTKDDSPKTISQARGVTSKDNKSAPSSISELNALNRTHYKQPTLAK